MGKVDMGKPKEEFCQSGDALIMEFVGYLCSM